MIAARSVGGGSVGTPPLKPALLFVSALLLSADRRASKGVPGTVWGRSLLDVDAQVYADSPPRLPCEGGLR